MAREKGSVNGEHLAKHPDYVLMESDGSMTKYVQEILEETVFGQEEACGEVAAALTRSLAGFSNPNRPEYVGLFLGEPGVGKTEMGRAVAKIFDPQDYESRLMVVDCNMFQQSHDVQRILGAPPSYVGYEDEPFITRNFLRRPNVIVFDEIEKADVALHRLLLRIMDKGRLEINNYIETVDEDCVVEANYTGLDFSNSVIILTSNIGSDELTKMSSASPQLGFGTKDGKYQVGDRQGRGVTAAKNYWRHMPEFINRLDSMVVFNPLNEKVLGMLVDKFLSEYLETNGRGIVVTEKLRKTITEEAGYKSGRDLRKALDRLVIAPAAEIFLSTGLDAPLIADLSPDGKKKVVFWVNKRMG